MKKCLIVFLLLLNPHVSFATHLLGGEMTYRCLGDGLYEIEIVMYVDCGPSNINNQTFDGIISISAYKNSGEYFGIKYAENPEITQVNAQEIEDVCLEIPASLCIQKGVYKCLIGLPAEHDGFQIAYQRCCKNPSIGNVNNPEITGSTFTTFIPGTSSVNECNNSAFFTKNPPIAVCLGNSIKVDMSAQDVDGDSLSYSFTTPFTGGTSDFPRQTSPPPFINLTWNPPYSSDYPIDSDPEISINPRTGIVSGTPNTMGLYSIGIKVTEFRNGIPINEIIRDFTIRVVDCNQTTSSFPLNDWYCNSLKVEFTNNSRNADTYLWEFGDDRATSNLFEPNHTYSDTGMYTVRLIANPNTSCADTSSVTFPLYTELLPNFVVPEPQCVDNNSFNFRGKGILPTGTNIFWDFGSKASPNSSEEINPEGVRFSEQGVYPITFQLQYNNCNETFTRNVDVFDEDIFPEIPSSQAQCFNENSFDFTVDGIYPSNSIFTWDFGPNANPQYSSLQNPSNIQFSTSGLQNVSVEVSSNGCEEKATANVDIFKPIPLEIFTSSTKGCEPHEIEFKGLTDSDDYNFNWNLGNGSRPTSKNVQATYTKGIYQVSLSVTDKINACEETVQLEIPITIVPKPIAAFSVINEPFILGDTLFIKNKSTSANSFIYDFSTGYSSREDEPLFIPASSGEFNIWQYAINKEFGCMDSSYVEIDVDNQYTIWLPNTFTPNQDELNDYFMPVTTRIKNIHLQIFNSSGKSVFNDLGAKPKWNGKNRNELDCPIGAYAYLIHFQDLEDHWRERYGVIHLIR